MLYDEIKDMHDSLLKLMDGDENKVRQIYEALHKNGLNDKTYAQAFKLMFYNPGDSKNSITYSAEDKKWYRGNKPISDMQLISIFSEAVYFVKSCVELSWKICQYGAVNEAWLNPKEYARSELVMDDVETFAKLRACLKTAATIMPKESKESDAIDWGSVCGCDEEEQDIGVDVSFPEDSAEVYFEDGDDLPPISEE